MITNIRFMFMHVPDSYYQICAIQAWFFISKTKVLEANCIWLWIQNILVCFSHTWSYLKHTRIGHLVLHVLLEKIKAFVIDNKYNGDVQAFTWLIPDCNIVSSKKNIKIMSFNLNFVASIYFPVEEFFRSMLIKIL